MKLSLPEILHDQAGFEKLVPLVPKLQLGNAVLEALASSYAKLELRSPHFQAGAWEREKE